MAFQMSARDRAAGRERPRMALFYCLAALSSVATISQPYVIGQLINHLQQGGPHVLESAVKYLSIYVGLMLLFWTLYFLQPLPPSTAGDDSDDD